VLVCPYAAHTVWNEKHTGLYNLLIVIVVSTNFRLALEVRKGNHTAELMLVMLSC
jgi:hypothetical protein